MNRTDTLHMNRITLSDLIYSVGYTRLAKWAPGYGVAGVDRLGFVVIRGLTLTTGRVTRSL